MSLISCIGKDHLCPCQDGDACHYKDTPTTKAWPIPTQPQSEFCCENDRMKRDARKKLNLRDTAVQLILYSCSIVIAVTTIVLIVRWI